MRKPAVVAINKYGLSFGKNQTSRIYALSKREFRAYYRFVCLRCGFSFAGNRHQRHRLDECDEILRERKADSIARVHSHRNLYGKNP